eukprot:2093633-Alexandrium_andersonii.AAC.1
MAQRIAVWPRARAFLARLHVGGSRACSRLLHTLRNRLGARVVRFAAAVGAMHGCRMLVALPHACS